MELRRHKRTQRSLSPTHTSLMLACQQEIKEDVRAILERQPGAALQRDRTGKNALHYCAENVNVECASRLLSAVPTLLNAPDEEGYTPLHLAVISGNKPMVKYLLTKGADSRAVDSEKHSCVHWATVSGDTECLDLLINSGADPSTPDIHGAFPVHYAAQMCGPNSEMGNDVKVGLRVLQKLLSRGVDVACVDRDGRPPLLWAASGETRASKTYCPSGSSDAILALVKAGANVNAVDQDGLTALHCAASRGHIDCLETLLTLCGAEVDKVDESGCSALFYAVTLGHADCTNLLLTFGSHCNRQDNKGRTPAHCGAAKGQIETLKILSQHKANLWMRNAKGDMPLHEAVQSGRKDLGEWLLLQHQGSVNVSNSNGRTPLHIAAITNNVDMCKVLMDYGAFINPIMRNSKGQHLTPLDAALHRGNRSCAKYLSLHGALPASKILNKKEYNRFTEAHLSETVEMSPSTKRRLLRDTSAQTEPHLKDVVIQTRVDQKTVSATANLTRGHTHSQSEIKKPCTGKSFRCSEDGSGKPIIAKVYVHTKRSKVRRSIRKPTGYRRDCQGQKLSTEEQRKSVHFQRRGNETSDNQSEKQTPLQTDLESDIPIRKKSQPTLFEEPMQPTFYEERPQPTPFKERSPSIPSEKHSPPITFKERSPSIPINERSSSISFKGRSSSIPINERSSSIPFKERTPSIPFEEHSPPIPPEERSPPITFEESSSPIPFEERSPPIPIEERSPPIPFEERSPPIPLEERSPPIPFEERSPPIPLEERSPPIPFEERSPPIPFEESLHPVEEDDHPDDFIEEESRLQTPEQEDDNTDDQKCNCYHGHEAETGTCDCGCHNQEARSQLLSVEERRRSSLRTKNYDFENQSPLSSIRSLESTVKDSGFSDDVDRGHQSSSSDDERADHSDSDIRYVKRKSRHIARYIVSSGAADTFRLEEDDEEDEEKVVKPRSSSLPHMRKRDVNSETCPRLLNRPTLTKAVQKSLKKYQMERRLFYELQELKRKQITTSELDEREAMQKILERFRNHVLSPFMTDFQGPLTFRAFEKYLYEQLRKLSMCGKIPKPKFSRKESDRMYIAPVSRKASHQNGVLCMCGTHKCHHNTRHDSDFALPPYDTSEIPTLPEIIPKTPIPKGDRQYKASVNRSKSWDRLDDAPSKKSFSICPEKLGNVHTSHSLPSLKNPFPRRVPAALLAAISERLGPDVHPEDTIVVEMSAENVSSKMRHAFTVQELQEVVSRYEEQIGRKVKPIPLETVLDPDDDGPITFEIRHGKERNVFKLPAGKLKDNKKWQVIFTIGKCQKNLTSLHAK